MKNNVNVKAILENWENKIYGFLKENLENLKVKEKERAKILLLSEEIFVNIVSYAYPNSKIGNAEIIFEAKKKEIILTFADSGISFNPLLVPEPETKSSAKERRIGGWGIFIAKKLSDKMEYKRENKQNILTITKFLEDS